MSPQVGMSPSFKGVALTMELGPRPRHKRWVRRMAKKLRPLEPRNLALAADLNLREHGGWSISTAMAPATSLFFLASRRSCERETTYDSMERDALNTRIADAQIVTPKIAVSFPQKRRRQSALRRPSVGAPGRERAWQSRDMWLG
jgi:hypothetical protein